MTANQTIWRECTDEEKADRTVRGVGAKKRKSGWLPPTFFGTKMITGENKSRPGARIRANREEDTFTYTA